MEVREAVEVAKNWVKAVLADEHVSNIGLEEVEYDDKNGIWLITVGFSRPWNTPREGGLSGVAATLAISSQKRAYRVISVRNANKQVIAMKRRMTDLE